MERQDILAAMAELKLLGMRDSFDEIIGKGVARRNEFYPLIAALLSIGAQKGPPIGVQKGPLWYGSFGLSR